MKKKVISIVFALIMLGGCGKTATPLEEFSVLEQSSVQTQEQSVQENKTEESSKEEETVADTGFEDESWKEMFEYATAKIDSLKYQIEVTYKEYPKPYVYMSKSNGSENGGYPPYEARIEDGQLKIDIEKDWEYRDYYYSLTLSAYRDDCFDKIVVTKIWKDGNNEEIIEEHENDEYMQEFRTAVLKYQEDATIERENTRLRTDVQRDDACAEYGLEAIKQEMVGNYEVVTYSNELCNNKTVYMEICKEGKVIATIRDLKTLRNSEEYDSEREDYYKLRFYNYEGSKIFDLDKMGQEDYEEIIEYDEYGNSIYYEDVCNLSVTEYDYSDVEYQYILRQCKEIMNGNNGYRQNWM